MSIKQRAAVRLASATFHQLRAPDRLERLRTLSHVWTAMSESEAIPQRFPSELWPGIETITAQVRLNKSGWELSPAEQLILDAIVRFTAPSTNFEFGTLTGSGTVLLADATSDGATVHTVDVPDEYFSGHRWWAQLAQETTFTPDMIGREFKTNPEYQSKIVQHRADLARFDVTSFRSAVDLVFVDDGHTYEDVSRDSRLALEMVAPGGSIIWDDYGPPHHGSVRALNDLAERVSLARIRGTRLVAYRHPGV